VLTPENPLTRNRLGAFVAVLFGTAIVALTLTLFSSASPQVPDRFAAVAVAVQNPRPPTPADPFPESRPWSPADSDALAVRLAAAPGVTAAIPDHRLYAQPVIGDRPVGAVQEGHGWSSAALAADVLVAGRAAGDANEVVVGRDLGVAVGGRITVLTAGGPAQWTVTGLIAAPRLYVSDPVAARLGPGVRMIGLLGRPDLRAVRQIVGAATVLHGASLGELEPRADARTRWIGMQVLSAMAALALFASVFVIASTFAFSVNQRRREIGLLRAVGATPRQVRQSVLREAATIGGTAAFAGTALGVLLAPALGDVLVGAGFEPATYTVGLRFWPIAAGLAAGPVVSVVGAFAAARRAARVGPLDALRRAEVETRPMTRLRWAFGLAFAAAGAVAGLLTAGTDDLTDMATDALLGAMALVSAGTLLAPAVVPPLVRVLLWPARGPLGMLARESALAGARRTASTAAPVLLTIAFAVFIAGNVQTSAGAYADRRADAVRAGSVLVPDGTPGLADSVDATAPLSTDVYLGTAMVAAIGVQPESAAGVARELPGPDAVVVTRSLAAQLGRGPGDTITVTFADGTETALRIVRVAQDGAVADGIAQDGTVPNGTVPAELLLNRTTVRAHDPSALASAVLLPEGTSVLSPERTSVHASVGARVVDVAMYARRADAEEDRLVWIFTLLLIGVSVGYGAMAVANTLVMATSHRAPDFRRLRLAGATPRQVLLTVAAESTVVVAIGAVLGSAVALFALWGTTQGLRAQTGVPVTLTVPWPTAGAAVAACLVLALAASVLPARTRLQRPHEGGEA
jgi:putative ABC transport system permease protein